MDDKDINLLIPVNSVTDEFICPICFEIIKESYMTPCSHNFCKECILECLNRKKICPCCNSAATQQQLAPNKQFDRLISIITTEKDKASKEYFDNLISGGGAPLRTSNKTVSISPLEQTLLGHMQKHIKTYHDYVKKFEENTVSRKLQIKEKYSLLLKNQKKDQKRKLKAEREEKYNELSIIQKQTSEIIEKTLERYLKEFTIPDLVFPVIVHISVPCKNELIKYVELQPRDTILALRNEVSRHMEAKGDCVVAFEKANIFALVQGEGDAGIPIIDEHIAIVETFHPEPGAVFVLQGQLKCSRDAPKKCYKQIHPTLEKPTPIDYFTCRTCTLNWLCNACVENCHKGHDVTTFHMGHLPTWACCYCSKKKCNLLQANK